MPLFLYTITVDGNTRTTELRKSNPQGWIHEALSTTFPEGLPRSCSVQYPRLEKAAGNGEKWNFTLVGKQHRLSIEVVKIAK